MGRPKGSKNKPKITVQPPLKAKRGRPPKSAKSVSEPLETPAIGDPIIRTGLFEINEVRPWKILKGPINKFTDVKRARKALTAARELETTEGRNPYRIVLLPLGPKDEGLLP